MLEQTDLAEALGRGGIADRFLGNAVEIAIVTRDHRRTMEGLWRLGIGPWQVYTFSPENTTNQTYRGRPSPFTLKVCFAKFGNLVWELIEPSLRSYHLRGVFRAATARESTTSPMTATMCRLNSG